MAGHAYTYRCSSCNFEEYFKQGHGFLVKPQQFNEYMSNGQKLFHYEIHNKIIALSSIHTSLVINATFQVYKCPKCNILHNKVQVTLSEGSTLLHTNRFKCIRCHGRLKLTNIHRLRKAACPVCGKSQFHRQNTGSLFGKK